MLREALNTWPKTKEENYQKMWREEGKSECAGLDGSGEKPQKKLRGCKKGIGKRKVAGDSNS